MDRDPHAMPPTLSRLVSSHGAPLRIDARYRVNASPARLFAVLGDLEGITRFFPMVHHAWVTHEAGRAGEGSQRVCSIRGMGKVNERIVWWEPPAGYAYRASGPFMPLRDHLGVISISGNGAQGAILGWRQYFHTRFGPLGALFPAMMKLMMSKAIANVEGLLGKAGAARP